MSGNNLSKKCVEEKDVPVWDTVENGQSIYFYQNNPMQ